MTYSRRTLILSALVLAIVIIGGVVLVTAQLDSGPRQDTQGQLPEADGAKPHIIPRPNEGVAPKTPGDRGGWEQLTVFGIMLASMAIIGVVIFRGTRGAREGKAQWIEAGRSGHDGALVAFDQLAPPEAFSEPQLTSGSPGSPPRPASPAPG